MPSTDVVKTLWLQLGHDVEVEPSGLGEVDALTHVTTTHPE